MKINQKLANRPNLYELERILNDELSEEATRVIDGYLPLRSWIYDAMEEYAKFRMREILETIHVKQSKQYGRILE